MRTLPGQPPQLHCQQQGEPSSRVSAEWAGWHRDGDDRWTWIVDEQQHGVWEERLAALESRRWQAFSWLSARALLDSVNDRVAKYLGDLVDPRRQRWVAAQRAAGQDPDTPIEVDGRSFMIVGDPGEIDASQFAVMPVLEAVDSERPTEFLVVLSDVIYPAGEVNDYPTGFYEAFKHYGKPIYALPGNHDWYDGLNGFMWNFCGAEALPPTEYRSSSYSASERAARALWRRSSRPNRDDLQFHRSPHGEAWAPRQPGPYWAMDVARKVRLIAIDTGVTGELDREQGAWLLRMASKPDRHGNHLPKVLLTGKPLWVDGRRDPGKIDWGSHDPPVPGMHTVDDVVRRREHDFRASVGGDVHNYQRLTVWLEDGRSIEYVVTGGGGAYMSEVLRIKVNPSEAEVPPEVVPPREPQFRCYPTRADAVAYYTRWYGRRVLRWWLLALAAAVGAAAAIRLWDRGGAEVGGQQVWEVAAASVLGVCAILGVGFALAAVARVAFGQGARFTALLLIAPAVYALASFGASEALGHTWDWAWKVALIGLGVLLLPIVVIVVNYYGFATPLRRRLGLAVLVVLLVGGFAARFGPATATIVTIASALLAVALLLWLLEPGREVVRVRLFENPFVGAAVTLALYHAPIVVTLARWNGAWALLVAVAASLALIVVVAGLLSGFTAAASGLALFSMARGRVDPDDVFAILRGDPYNLEEALSPECRQGNAQDKGARRIVDFLTSHNRLRRLSRVGLAQVGNADTPPMFKNFVRAEVSEDGSTLELSCYGVTGWAAHEQPGQVPREDCVRIPLTGGP